MELIERIYEKYHADEEFRQLVEEFHRDTKTLLILMVYNEGIAKELVELIKDFIKDKVVLEIGAGAGFLAVEMGKYAKEVFAIEKDPAWSWVFVKELYKKKPKNVTFIFGEAERFIGLLKPDVVVIFSFSGLDYLVELAKKFNPKNIIVNGYVFG